MFLLFQNKENKILLDPPPQKKKKKNNNNNNNKDQGHERSRYGYTHKRLSIPKPVTWIFTIRTTK